ncbi:FAD-dependent oxidoreductase [Aspergillus novofumigatus IBT 16806]|uniref:Putative salicylate hydroxylase n=1 Tax=Aspergillus novofumigatus (strain IBT 16806) TaxID=1392255 RepID=A0A2I1BWF2_ASPN1|nr:putative salicylate hydroxylase [Aspergillus novofumigatus IBT 16806]PKX89686.1 putative salicylate hydroxylase [Aspergillus novofumigatus IBT 16806]
MEKNIIIVGGGMCGLASAIAISKALSSAQTNLTITVYELRSVPSTLGGPVNLTPKALRCLDMLGVLDELKQAKAGCEVDAIQILSLRTGKQVGTIDYTGPEGTGFGGYKGWRVMRYELLQAMLRVIARLPAVKIEYGKKLVRVEELAGATAPDRKPSYSAVAAAYGFVKAKAVLGENGRPFFKDTALLMSRYGSVMTTFCDHARELVYVVVLMRTEEQGSREGWKLLEKDQEMVRKEGRRITQQSAIPDAEKFIEAVEDWTFYPIYLLPPNGQWATDRVLLLGDAAHAMPPKGESIGHALEDAIKFAEVLSRYGVDDPKASFRFFEDIQRKKVEAAHQAAVRGWMPAHDMGAVFSRVFEWITPLFLWWMTREQQQDFLEDPMDIPFPDRDESARLTYDTRCLRKWIKAYAYTKDVH